MPERRPLTEGIKPTQSAVVPAIDAAKERQFVYRNNEPAPPGTAAPVSAPAPVPARSPVSTRIRSDYAAALKRASLERQLEGKEPSTLQDILEEALGPWLKANGYLP